MYRQMNGSRVSKIKYLKSEICKLKNKEYFVRKLHELIGNINNFF